MDRVLHALYGYDERRHGQCFTKEVLQRDTSACPNLGVGVAEPPELSLESLEVAGDVSQRPGEGR